MIQTIVYLLIGVLIIGVLFWCIFLVYNEVSLGVIDIFIETETYESTPKKKLKASRKIVFGGIHAMRSKLINKQNDLINKIIATKKTIRQLENDIIRKHPTKPNRTEMNRMFNESDNITLHKRILTSSRNDLAETAMELKKLKNIYRKLSAK